MTREIERAARRARRRTLLRAGGSGSAAPEQAGPHRGRGRPSRGARRRRARLAWALAAERAAFGGRQPDPATRRALLPGPAGRRRRPAAGPEGRRPPAGESAAGSSASASSQLAPATSRGRKAMSWRGRLTARAAVSRPARP